MSALSLSLITPPQFPPSPPGVPNLPLVAEERRGQHFLLGAPQLRWIAADLLHKVSFGRNGVTKEEFIQTIGEQFGDRRFVAALGDFISRHGGGAAFPERKKRGQDWCLTLLANNESVVSSSASVRSAWGLVLGCHVFPGAVSWASECEQTWSRSECVAELLEFTCVESERSAVPLVRLTVPWAAD